MELEGDKAPEPGTPDNAAAEPDRTDGGSNLTPTDRPKSFAERYARFCGAVEGPEDFAANHDQYRLGTPGR